MMEYNLLCVKLIPLSYGEVGGGAGLVGVSETE